MHTRFVIQWSILLALGGCGARNASHEEPPAPGLGSDAMEPTRTDGVDSGGPSPESTEVQSSEPQPPLPSEVTPEPEAGITPTSPDGDELDPILKARMDLYGPLFPRLCESGAYCNGGCLVEVGDESNGCRLIAIEESQVLSHLEREGREFLFGYRTGISRVELDSLTRTTLTESLENLVGSPNELMSIDDQIYFVVQARLMGVPASGGQAREIVTPNIAVTWARQSSRSIYYHDASPFIGGSIFRWDADTGEALDTGQLAERFEIYEGTAYFGFPGNALFVARTPDLSDATQLRRWTPRVLLPVDGGVFWTENATSFEYWWSSEDGTETVRQHVFDIESRLLDHTDQHVLVQQMEETGIAHSLMPIQGGPLEQVAFVDAKAHGTLGAKSVYLSLVYREFEDDQSASWTSTRSYVVQIERP